MKMTPFGIRKKLKSLFGLDKKQEQSKPQRPKHVITFELSNGTSYQVEGKEGDSLVLVSGRGPYPIATGCADGTCATCKVEILEGIDNLSQPDEYEEKTKTENGVESHLRLGCQAAVLGPGIKARIINVLGEELVD